MFAPTFDVTINWNVSKSLEEKETFGNLSGLGSELMYNMFKRRMIPWIKLKSEFEKRNVKTIALSVDTVDQHLNWINNINETQNTNVDFPIIADPDKKISELYDMIHPNASLTHTVRSVFIIGPDKKIKLMITYPASTGRNFNELLRVIDSLQLTSKHNLVTPANWQKGEDCIVSPALSTEEAIQKFPKGVNEIRPYLRYTPDPE